MALTKRLLDTYNRPETVAVVSLYPKKGEIYSAGASGVASYSKNVVRHLSRPTVVLADINPLRLPLKKGEKSQYEEDNSLVMRVWERNQTRMWVQLLMVLRQLTQVRSLLIHFDFSMYGGMLTSGLLIPFLAVTRLLGFKPVVVSHHVIRDVRKLSGQVGLGEGVKAWVKTQVYNAGFKMFYWLLGKVAEKVIVLEEPLRKRLLGVVPESKVVVVPHAVDNDLTKPTKREARKRLGYSKDEAVVMFFGYVNWFKGADFFAQAFASKTKLLGKKTRFVMAGGQSPTLKDKAYYRQFYTQVKRAVKDSKAVELTGYVPQAQIADYFAAADLVVFPYREFMCASGVLAQVFAYEKPFIVSDVMARVFKAGDLKRALRDVQLRRDDISFGLTPESLVDVTERVLENGLKQKLVALAKVVKRGRSFEQSAILYEKALAVEATTQAAVPAKGVLAYAVEE